MRKFGLVVAAAICWPLGAHAADVTVNSALAQPLYSPVPAHNWGGLYVGGSLGYVSGSVTGPVAPPTGLSGTDIDVHAGYDFQSGNWVYGPFIAVPFPTASSTVAVPVKIDWAVVGGARLGYAIDHWLPYALAAGVVGGGTATGLGSATHTGYSLGVGLEYGFDNNWSIGVRYAYVSMDGQRYSGIGPFGCHGNSVVGTLNYKFH